MKREEYETRKERAEHEPLVIAKIDEGFRVHSPNSPGNIYRVTGTPDEPRCTCPDFDHHAKDPEWRCKHILAVEARFGGRSVTNDESEREERAAIRDEARPSLSGTAPTASEMIIKRSVSPDGRIDSVSVEFSCPVDGAAAQDIKAKAMQTLGLQNEIVSGFLGRNGARSENGNRFYRQDRSDEPADRGAVPAQMLGIGVMDTRWGRRLFLRVQVNGGTLRYIGNQKKLAEVIEAAGFPDASKHVSEGVRLNLPCRVTTKPSDDGRYVNIDQVFPAAVAKSRWQGRR